MGENLTLNYSKDKNLFPIRSSSPGRWKPNFKFHLRTEARPWFNLNHRTGGNLTLNYSKNKNRLPGSILIIRQVELTSNYSKDWNRSPEFNLNHREGKNLTLNSPNNGLTLNFPNNGRFYSRLGSITWHSFSLNKSTYVKFSFCCQGVKSF